LTGINIAAGNNSYHGAHGFAQHRSEQAACAGGVMFERSVKDLMDCDQGLQLAPQTSVRAAAEAMAAARRGAVMVVADGHLAGIFTERDALFRVIARGRDPEATSLAEVMTAEPRTVSPTDSYGYALVLMQEGGFRHAPVIEGGRPIGMISARNAMDPELEDFVSEAKRREHIRQGH
jgi:signal-transduction protein with cAMP-binding, CBS, and nucleotidyltransferase domain